MALGLLAKGIMGAGKAASGAKMAKNIFKRKGGKDAPDVPASEQTIDVKAETVQTVQPTTPLVPIIGSIDATSISKATSPTGTEDLEGTAFRIKTTLVDVDTLLKGSFALDKIREEERKKKESKKAAKGQEKKLESAAQKNGKKFGLGKLVPKKAKTIFGNIINFFVTLLLGKILMSLLDNIGAFERIAKVVGAIANFIVEWGGKLFNALVSFIDFSYSIFDGLRGTVGDLFGESGLAVFDGISGALNKVMNLTIGLTLAMIAFSNEFGSSLVDWGRGFISIFKRGLARAVPRLLIKLFGKKTAGTILTKIGLKSAITGATTGGTVAGGTAAGGTVAGGTGGGIAGGAAAATVGIVAGAGLLASGLGEGIFQMKKQGQKKEADTYKRFKERSWLNPMKYVFGGLHLAQKFINFQMSMYGHILDILGTPFRYIIELVRYPFLDEAGKKKQHENLAKFDARIRENIREMVNALSLGILAKDKGAFGSLFGKKGTDAMGYTKDGKTESRRIKDQITNKKADEVLNLIDGKDTKKGEVKGETPPPPKTNRDETRTQTTVSGRFDINTGKAYINDQEVSSDEYVKFQNLSKQEQIQQYGIKKSPNISSESKSYNGIETYPSYDEAGGGTITYIVSQKGSSGGGETSSGTNAKVTKMSEGLILSGSGGESNNSYDVLAKR